MQKYIIFLMVTMMVHVQLAMNSKLPPRHSFSELFDPKPSRDVRYKPRKICESPDDLLALIQTETLKSWDEHIDNTHIFKAMTPDSINSIYPLHEAVKRWVLCENNFKTLDRIENNYFIHIIRIVGMIAILRKNKANIWLKKNGQTPLEFFESEIIRNHLDGNQAIQLLLSSQSML